MGGALRLLRGFCLCSRGEFLRHESSGGGRHPRRMRSRQSRLSTELSRLSTSLRLPTNRTLRIPISSFDKRSRPLSFGGLRNLAAGMTYFASSGFSMYGDFDHPSLSSSWKVGGGGSTTATTVVSVAATVPGLKSSNVASRLPRHPSMFDAVPVSSATRLGPRQAGERCPTLSQLKHVLSLA